MLGGMAHELPPLGSNSEYHDSLRDLLVRAGELAMSYFQSVAVEYKADGSPVTEADRACEALIAAGLRKRWPTMGIAAEEGTHHDGADVWYVDPIDGTGPFTEGLAHWGPTVCLVRDGQVEVGAFYTPRIGEFWYAERGRGAWLTRDGQTFRLPGPPDRTIGSQDVLFAPSRVHRLGPLDWPGKVRVLGSTAAHLALVAAGGALAAVVPKWSPWDVGCGLLLLSETTGVVRDFAQQPIGITTHVNVPFVAGSPGVVSFITHPERLQRALRGGITDTRN